MSGLRILHTHPVFVVVDKPAGIPVIPGRTDPEGATVRSLLEKQLSRPVWVVHRLDRDTTGALLFALDPGAHRTFNTAFEKGTVDKRYLALVRGAYAGPEEIDVALAPARRSRMRPVREGEEGKPARTRVRVVERFGDRATLVEAQPLTGRTHQIRVHLASVGHPLLFDHQYGGKTQDELLSRTPLHASALSFEGIEGLPDTRVEAPLPDDMAAVIRLLREG